MLTEALLQLAPIEPMELADIPAGLELVREAGWNQVEADWRIMLRLGQAFCVRHDGRAIATALTLPYADGGFGWISMVLVHGPYRGRGIATRLLDQAIDAITAAGLTPVLDATPAGRRVYEPLGFKPLFDISRWRGTGLGVEPPRNDPQYDVTVMAAADRRAFGSNRGELLADLASRDGAVRLASLNEDTFLLSRVGRTATQIGPLVAASESSAARLLETALDAIAGPVLLDLPDGETALHSLLLRRGFSKERPFTRMALGPGRQLGTAANMLVIAGPELG